MNTVHSSLLISAMVFCVNSAMAQEAGQAVTLQYGTVESVGVVHNDGKRAGGAVVGDCVVVEQGQYTNDEIEQAVIKVRTLCED